jgi:hypothetical protein
MKFFFIPP